MNNKMGTKQMLKVSVGFGVTAFLILLGVLYVVGILPQKIQASNFSEYKEEYSQEQKETNWRTYIQRSLEQGEITKTSEVPNQALKLYDNAYPQTGLTPQVQKTILEGEVYKELSGVFFKEDVLKGTIKEGTKEREMLDDQLVVYDTLTTEDYLHNFKSFLDYVVKVETGEEQVKTSSSVVSTNLVKLYAQVTGDKAVKGYNKNPEVLVLTGEQLEVARMRVNKDKVAYKKELEKAEYEVIGLIKRGKDAKEVYPLVKLLQQMNTL